MKKFFVSSLILFLSFFGIKNVNADLKWNVVPDIFRVNGINSQMKTFNLSNIFQVWGLPSTTGLQNSINFVYADDFNFLEEGKEYTVSFTVYYNNIAYFRTSSDTTDTYYAMSRGNFIVQWEDGVNDRGSFCTTTVSNENANLFTVVCDNVVKTPILSLRFDVSQLEVFENNPLFGFAIYDGITYNEKSDSSIADTLKEQNKKLDELNNSITSSDTSSSQNQANSFFEGFDSDDYGLSDIITMPLELIRGLTSNSCVALNLTIPFVNKTFQLPCMSSIYSQYFGNFFTLYQTITFGFVAYWVVVKIFALVKGFKDPNDDKVEVMDL